MVGKRPAVHGRAFRLDAMSAGSGEAGEDTGEVIDGGVAVADEENAGACRGAFLTRATGVPRDDQEAKRNDGAHATTARIALGGGGDGVEPRSRRAGARGGGGAGRRAGGRLDGTHGDAEGPAG